MARQRSPACTIARDAALLSGGIDLRVNAQASLGIGYFGEVARHAQDHSVKGTFRWNF
jgi:uncharacterized protein with beta-barrel porin domain